MRRTVTALLTTTLLFATLIPASASAAAEPTRKQIIKWCNQTPDSCEFVPNAPPTAFIGAQKQLTGRTFNCTSETSTKTLTDTATDTTTDNVGGEVTTGASFEIFSATFKLSYNKSWQKTRTITISRQISLKAGEVGWFDRGPALQKVTGTFVYKQAKPIDGAHFWFAEDVTVTGPDPDGGDGDIVEQSRAMTTAEMNATCK